mmetsp:Transcript_116206/g.276204  ORF Transcript_116206/g.276204 Transcript_116206/m.276204 type:complete len:235 (-) Transcript_116206:291-995(-)
MLGGAEDRANDHHRHAPAFAACRAAGAQSRSDGHCGAASPFECGCQAKGDFRRILRRLLLGSHPRLGAVPDAQALRRLSPPTPGLPAAKARRPGLGPQRHGVGQLGQAPVLGAVRALHRSLCDRRWTFRPALASEAGAAEALVRPALGQPAAQDAGRVAEARGRVFCAHQQVDALATQRKGGPEGTGEAPAAPAPAGAQPCGAQAALGLQIHLRCKPSAQHPCAAQGAAEAPRV